jgi:surfactin synthase thioesterase subunit
MSGRQTRQQREEEEEEESTRLREPVSRADFEVLETAAFESAAAVAAAIAAGEQAQEAAAAARESAEEHHYVQSIGLRIFGLWRLMLHATKLRLPNFYR